MAVILPINGNNLYCAPGSHPEVDTSPEGLLDAYICVYPDETTNSPIPITVPVIPPGWTSVVGAPPRHPGPGPPSGPTLSQTTPPPAVFPTLPPGGLQNWTAGAFAPTAPTPSTFTSQTSTEGGGFGLGASAVVVNVNNAVNVADQSASNAVQNVANAVGQGIADAASTAGAVVRQTVDGLTSAINNQTNIITSGVNQSFSGIGGVINGIEGGIASTLGGIGTTIGNEIFGAINPVTTALSQIITIISQQIGGLAGAIGDAVGRVIPVIVAAVTGAISPVTAVLDTIRAAITGQIGAITQLGSDISGGLTTIDATLGRVLHDWQTYNTQFVEQTTGYGTGETLHKDFSSIVAALSGLVASLSGKAVFKASDFLAPPCNSATLQSLIDAPYKLGDQGNGFFTDMIIGLWGMILNVFKVFPGLLKANEVVTQVLDQECPTGLLPIASLVDADLRGFLTPTQVVAEAGKNDLDPGRYKTLRDLAIHQMSPNELVEALYRGIVTQEDYQSALAAQGWTRGQQTILQALAVALLPVADLEQLRRRGQISDGDLDTALKAQRWDDAQRKALISLVFRPPNFQEAIAGGTAEDALTALGVIGSTGPPNIPEYIQRAAQAEGLDQDTTNQRWLEHWNLGSLSIWIDLYFRGVVSIDKVEAVAERQFVPRELVPMIVAGSRPLIQFRTISTMLHLGLISTQKAGELLLQHGYTPENAQILIDYAKRPGAAAKAAGAARQHEVSLGIAKAEYVDGSISEQEYYQVLIAHGFTPEGANAEIALENTREAMLRRKENAQLVVDEYGAGLINEQQALAQLASLGLTVNELAKYAHKIRAFRARSAKQPSESDLNHFLQLSIISPDEYVSALQSQGYSSKWAQSFLAWREKPTSPSGSAASQSAPAPTGP